MYNLSQLILIIFLLWTFAIGGYVYAKNIDVRSILYKLGHKETLGGNPSIAPAPAPPPGMCDASDPDCICDPDDDDCEYTWCIPGTPGCVDGKKKKDADKKGGDKGGSGGNYDQDVAGSPNSNNKDGTGDKGEGKGFGNDYLKGNGGGGSGSGSGGKDGKGGDEGEEDKKGKKKRGKGHSYGPSSDDTESGSGSGSGSGSETNNAENTAYNPNEFSSGTGSGSGSWPGSGSTGNVVGAGEDVLGGGSSGSGDLAGTDVTGQFSEACPDALVFKDGQYLLYTKSLPKQDGRNPIIFSSMDEYQDYHDAMKANGKDCPVLFVQQEYNAQGDQVMRLREAPKRDKNGRILYIDADRENPPYNKGNYYGFDPTNMFSGVYTEIDDVHASTAKAAVSDNPMDPNWGGVEFTQRAIDAGKYTGNLVKRPNYSTPKGAQFIPFLNTGMALPK